MLLWRHKIGIGYIKVSAVFTLIVSAAILIFLCLYSWDAISAGNLKLFSSNWDIESNHYGMAPMLFGTFAVAFIALLIAIPIGLSTAIFISEFVPSNLQMFAKGLMEILAGIPSIVYGLIGVGLLSIWIADGFNIATGRTLFTAGIILSIMVLPTIISLCHQAFIEIPPQYKSSAKGLGLYPYEVCLRVILPMAKPQVIGAILLAMGRALGETMAVMLIVGSIDRLPEPLYNWLQPGQTMTAKMGRELAETSFGSNHFSALISIGLCLFVMVLIITLLGQLFYRKRSSHV